MNDKLMIKQCALRGAVMCLLVMTLCTHRARAQDQRTTAGDTSVHFIKTPLAKLMVSTDSTSRDSIQLLVQGIKQEKARLLTFVVQNIKGRNVAVNTGQRAWIYITDGTTVQLNARETVYSTFGGMSYGSYLSVDYALSIYDLDFFKDYPAGNIRIEYSGGIYNFDLSADAASALKAVMNAIK